MSHRLQLDIIFRGFDFANHFVEYSINYDVDLAPFYEIDERQFPSDQLQQNFFVSYLSELEPSSSEAECKEKAEAMIEVGAHISKDLVVAL